MGKKGRKEFVESLIPEYFLEYDKKFNKKNNEKSDAPDKGERERENRNVRIKKVGDFVSNEAFPDDSMVEGNLSQTVQDSFSGQIFEFSVLQKNLLEKLVELEAIRLGIFVPIITYENLSDPGFYNHEDCKIHLSNNAGSYSGLKDAVDTVIHETRHCYQFCVMEHPDGFSNIPNIINDYLNYSLDIYPEEVHNEEEWQLYLKNGLEVDAREYAKERTYFYQQYHAKDILSMSVPPEEVVKNQILMTQSGVSAKGTIAPVFVPADFDPDEIHPSIGVPAKNDINKKGGNYMRQFNISADKQKEAIGYYQTVISSIQQAAASMAPQLEDLIKAYPYKVTQDGANAFLKYYNELLPEEISKAINDWRNSDASISAAAKQFEAGEGAVHNAMKIEEELSTTVKDCFKKIEEFKINVDSTNTNEKAISDMEQIINGYLKNFESSADGWLKSLESREQEEMIYSCIHEVVGKTIVNVRGAFSGVSEVCKDIGIKFSDSHSKQTGTNISKGRAAASQVVDLKSKLNELGKLACL